MAEPSDQRLYFLLQRAAHRLRLDADRRCLAAAGITSAQLGALFAIRESSGSTQRELAGALGQRESAVTAMVGRLSSAGLISKQAHPREHRAVVLTITDAGHNALAAVQAEIQAFNLALRNLLGPDGFATTAAAMEQLAAWPPD